MAALTTIQIERLRRDLGDSATAVTTPELQDNWDRVDGAPNEIVRHEATLALCFKQLLAQAAKLHDYKAGAVDEKLSQVRKNLEDMYKLYAPSLERALGTGQQVAIGRLVARPNPNRRTPNA
jgi:hypothetical protein